MLLRQPFPPTITQRMRQYVPSLGPTQLDTKLGLLLRHFTNVHGASTPSLYLGHRDSEDKSLRGHM